MFLSRQHAERTNAEAEEKYVPMEEKKNITKIFLDELLRMVARGRHCQIATLTESGVHYIL